MGSSGLRKFSKLTCFSTLFLIFAGGMVTSTGSGLAVPDWPLSYGTFFPPMIGGVFYEHGHRMIASLVGFLTLCLASWLALKEQRKWIKILGFCALAAVLFQGILGGITVIFFLPTAVSVAHAVMAQTFFILTIIIAYSLSLEREARSQQTPAPEGFLRCLLGFVILIYIQLILGAIMRHTGSGLAILDFPTMGGYWFPPFNEKMLTNINVWRFDLNLEPISMTNVILHFIHRMGAFLIIVFLCLIDILGMKLYRKNELLFRTLVLVNILVAIQIILGIFAVLTIKTPIITSFHVVTGAAILGMAVLLLLRTAPLSLNEFQRKLIYHEK